MDDHPPIEARGAIEALRAGVPNRAAIRLLGERDGALVNSFLDFARALRSRDSTRAASRGKSSSGAVSARANRICSATCASSRWNGISSSASCRSARKRRCSIRPAVRRGDPRGGGSRRERRCDDRCALATEAPDGALSTGSRDGRRTRRARGRWQARSPPCFGSFRTSALKIMRAFLGSSAAASSTPRW